VTDAPPSATVAPTPVRSRTLFLVSCVGRKLTAPARAREMYASEWFKKARAFAEAHGDRWVILSAKHGVVDPDTEIAPYERTLATMPVAERRAWADRVLASLHPRLSGIERVVVFAGERYREFLLDPLRKLGVELDVPLAGLPIGKQLQWFGARSRECS
jgi:hypothetical protein